MKRILAIVFLIAVIVLAFWLFFNTGSRKEKYGTGNDEESTAVVAKKHSQAFNDKVDAAVASYLSLKDAFVNSDSVLAKQQAAQFEQAIENIPLSELDEDQQQTIASAARQQISDIKANTEPIINGETLHEMRRDFYMVSENMYPFLKTIGYEGEKLYWQNCPMAFGDEEANWLSSSRQINNPYLGKDHPQYKNTMLHCGEVKDSLYAK